MRSKSGQGPPNQDIEADVVDREQQRAEATVDALKHGQIPPYVRDRIQRQKAGDYPWTSDLSVSEWLLMRNYRLRPLGMVMGSSIFYIDLSTARYDDGWAWNGGAVSPDRALLDGRRLALNRMREEARLLGAHAVVGVQLNNRFDPDSGLTEFTAFGTAVVLDGQKVPADPFLCTVSAQEFVKLLQTGCFPITVGLGVATYHYFIPERPSQDRRNNQEMERLTKDVYLLRQRAVRDLRGQITEVGGTGVLAHETQLQVHKEHSVLEFFAMGTIVSTEPWYKYASPVVQTVLSLDH